MDEFKYYLKKAKKYFKYESKCIVTSIAINRKEIGYDALVGIRDLEGACGEEFFFAFEVEEFEDEDFKFKLYEDDQTENAKEALDYEYGDFIYYIKIIIMNKIKKQLYFTGIPADQHQGE